MYIYICIYIIPFVAIVSLKPAAASVASASFKAADMQSAPSDWSPRAPDLRQWLEERLSAANEAVSQELQRLRSDPIKTNKIKKKV